MPGLEPALGALRSAAATPIVAAASHGAGVDGWLGRRVGQFVLEGGEGGSRQIDAFLPTDPAAYQYVGMLPTEAVVIARQRAVSTMQAQVTMQDARDGVWHVAGLVDRSGAPVRFDEAGAIRQAWDSARFDTNHVAAGSVHGEHAEFVLRPDIDQELIRHTTQTIGADHAVVDTASAHHALEAASDGRTSLVAPMRALEQRALEPVASFEPFRDVPAAIRNDRLGSISVDGVEFQNVLPDADNARIVSGSVDDVIKLGRRMSAERRNQSIAGYRLGGDRYALLPLMGEIRTGGHTRPLYRAEPMPLGRSTASELAFTVNHRGAWTRDGSTFFGDGPLTSARHIDRLTALIETAPASLVAARETHTAAGEALERLQAEHAQAGRLARMGLAGKVRTAQERLAVTERRVASEEKQFARGQSENRARLALVVNEIERRHLPEREEWVARAGYDEFSGARRLRDLEPAPVGTSYDELVLAGRARTADSVDDAHIVLEAIDGSLWTGSYRTSATELAEAASTIQARPGAGRFDEAVRAMSAGGRTVQWGQGTRAKGVLT
jgi:hypothetical protein